MFRALSVLLLSVALAVAAAPPACCLAGPSLDYTPTVRVHTLIKLAVLDLPAGAAVSWSYDDAQVDAHEDGPRLTATAPPGRYRFVALIVSIVDGKPQVAQLRAVVDVVGTPTTPAPAPPAAPKPPGKAADARAALCQLSIGNSGCTATIIGPRRQDGRWDVLTANHCAKRPGDKGKIKTSTGQVLAVSRLAANADSDLCWMVTDAVVEDLPFALLAPEVPAVGVKVWHAGFGVDKPGNVETGTVSGAATADGQLPMRMSVSSGDSGGGIFRQDTGELVSAVCCTKTKGSAAPMWGGHCVAAAKLRPK